MKGHIFLRVVSGHEVQNAVHGCLIHKISVCKWKDKLLCAAEQKSCYHKIVLTHHRCQRIATIQMSMYKIEYFANVTYFARNLINMYQLA